MKPPADGVSSSGVKPPKPSNRPFDGVWMGTSESLGRQLLKEVVAGLLLLPELLLLLLVTGK